MKALFICDDEHEVDHLIRLFHIHYNKVPLICVPGMKFAEEKLSYDGPFGLVLIWCGMKDELPIKITQQLLELLGKKPYIYYGAPHHFKTRLPSNLYEINAESKLLTHPLILEEFKTVVDVAMEWAKQEEFEQNLIDVNRDDFLPIKIKNFYHYKQIPYNAYLEITHSKFIKLIPKNVPYSESLIASYSQKGAKFLYLEKEENLRFLEESCKNLTTLLQRDIYSSEEVFKVQIQATYIIHQYLRTIGVGENVILLTQEVIKKSKEIFEKDYDLIEILKKFPFVHRDLAEQSVLSTYFCEAVVSQLGWTSSIPRKQLGLASIIHDCTITNDDIMHVTSLNDAKLKEFSAEEQEEYRRHPLTAAKLAHAFTGFPETEFIIEQHHELPDGSGFPGGLNSFKLTPLSCTFVLITNLMSAVSVKGLNYKNIVRHIKDFSGTYRAGNFRETMNALRRIFKIE